MKQERVRRAKPTADHAQENELEPRSDRRQALDAKAQDTTQEIDALLDEIDAVLEENAYEVVEQYIQKGGE